MIIDATPKSELFTAPGSHPLQQHPTNQPSELKSQGNGPQGLIFADVWCRRLQLLQGSVRFDKGFRTFGNIRVICNLAHTGWLDVVALYLFCSETRGAHSVAPCPPRPLVFQLAPATRYGLNVFCARSAPVST